MCDVKNVDGAMPFGANQSHLNVAAMRRDHAADSVQQSEGVFCHDLDDGTAVGKIVVEMNGGMNVITAFLLAEKNAGHLAAQQVIQIDRSIDNIVKHLRESIHFARVLRKVVIDILK